MAFTIPPGKNATLAMAWKAHKAAQRAESKAARGKPVETEENAGSHAAHVKRSSTSAKKPAAKKVPAKGGRK